MKRIISALLSASLMLAMFGAMPAGASETGIINEYYNVDFDRDGDNANVWTNTAPSGMELAYCSWASEGKYTASIANDPLKGNNAVKFRIPKKPKITYYIGTRDNVPNDSFDNCVTWYELSFKCEGGLVPIQLEAAGTPLVIDENGNLKIGSHTDPTVNNASIQPDTWYHLVIAADNINKYNTDTRFYAWLNGEFLETAEKTTQCTVTRNSSSTTSWTRFLMNIGQNSQSAVYFYLDNLKMYTTGGSTDVADYDPKSIFEGTELSSDTWVIEGDKIRVAQQAMISDVNGKITSKSGKIAFYDEDRQISDDAMQNTPADGKIVYVTSSNGITVKKYEIVGDPTLTMPDMAKQYCDVDFDSASDTSDNWTNKVFGGLKLEEISSVNAYDKALVFDDIKGNNHIEFDVPKGDSGEYSVGAQEVPAKDSFGSFVTWHEISFKFDGAITDLRAYSAGTPYIITETGNIFIGGEDGDIVNNFELKTGEWYHLVVAADNLNKINGSDTRFYAWINGLPLETARSEELGCTASAPAAETSAWDKFVIKIGRNTASYAKVALDNIKMYKTDGKNDAAEYDAAVIYDGTELSSRLWVIDGGVVKVAKEATLADVAERLSSGGGEIVFFDGADRIAAKQMLTTKADGKIIYVRSTNGIGVKKYIIKTDEGIVIPDDVIGPNEKIDKWYYDVDFDQSGDTDTTSVNKAESGLGLNYSSGASSTDAKMVEHKLVHDDIRDSNIWRVKLKKRAASDARAYAIGQMSIGLTELGECTMWYELSFKFEKNTAHMYLCANGYPFEITEDGSLYVGGLASNSTYPGQKAENIKLTTDEWYHLVIAADNIDKSNGKTKYYAWVNGAEVITSETLSSGCAALQGGDITYADHYLLYMITSPAGEVNVKLDNNKFYTIKKAVKDTDFDPTAILKDTEISSYELKVDDNSIYIPDGETLSEAIALLNPIKGSSICCKDGESVSAEEAVVTPAVGSELFVKSTSGIGIKKYTIKDGLRLFDAKRTTAVWKKNGEENVSALSSLNKDDKLELTMEFVNDTGERQNGVLVLAVYNGSVLSGYSFTNIGIPAGGAAVTSEPVEITDSENLAVKAYIWNSDKDFTSKMIGIELK